MTKHSAFDLSGKRAIVTGAAQGIGRAIANAFINANIEHVECCDIQVSAEEPISGRMRDVILDVRSPESWQLVLSDFVKEYGAPDILVNNAGLLSFGTVENLALDDFQRMLDVNVIGTFLGMQAVIPEMKKSKNGSIINISSASGIQPSNFVSGYAATKFAVRGLTRAASLELGLHEIRVNSIHPGGVNTPMTNPLGASQDDLDKGFQFVPLQRGSTAQEIANGAVYLASDASCYCTGTEIVIDGGMTAGIYFPGLPGSPDIPD